MPKTKIIIEIEIESNTQNAVQARLPLIFRRSAKLVKGLNGIRFWYYYNVDSIINIKTNQ